MGLVMLGGKVIAPPSGARHHPPGTHLAAPLRAEALPVPILGPRPGTLAGAARATVIVPSHMATPATVVGDCSCWAASPTPHAAWARLVQCSRPLARLSPRRMGPVAGETNLVQSARWGARPGAPAQWTHPPISAVNGAEAKLFFPACRSADPRFTGSGGTACQVESWPGSQ